MKKVLTVYTVLVSLHFFLLLFLAPAGSFEVFLVAFFFLVLSWLGFFARLPGDELLS